MLKKVMVILNIEKLFLMFFSPVKKSTIQLSSLDIFIEHLIFLQKCIFKIKLTYFFPVYRYQKVLPGRYMSDNIA